MTECFPEKSSWRQNEQSAGDQVKRFERSNGLGTTLFNNIPLHFTSTLKSVTNTVCGEGMKYSV